MRKAIALSLLVSLSAFAQPQSSDRPITAEERRQLGLILAHLLETMYVLPEKGKELAAQLRDAFAGGEKYAQAATPAALAELVNRDLAAANDRHLNLRHGGRDAARPPLTVAEWEQRRAAMRSGAPSPNARPRDYDRDVIRLTNFGVLGAEVLEGNVGYLRMNAFPATDETRAAISSAMALLSNTDAMIVDVRNCPGGSPDTVSYLASYFFGPEKRVLMKRYNRPADETWESTTVNVPGRRMPDVDLYVLTGRTGSACESFAFTLQQWGRARTVGEKSGGAGYNNMLIDVGLGLTFSVSVGTATHPKTGKGWEAVGVIPDIPVSVDRARETAHAEALRALAKKVTSEPHKRMIESALRKLGDAPAAAASR